MNSSANKGASSPLSVTAGFGVWQDIETAPRDGTTILAHYPSKVGYVARQDIAPIHWSGWGGGVWENSNSGMKPSDQPTHWMPLPPSPNPGSQTQPENKS